MGYVYYQLTGDSGSGDRVGAVQVARGVGRPRGRVRVQVRRSAGVFNLRGYWEFWAQNRVEGYALFATLSIPLGAGN